MWTLGAAWSGEQFLRAGLRRGLTDESVAERWGVSTETCRSWEAGVEPPAQLRAKIEAWIRAAMV